MSDHELQWTADGTVAKRFRRTAGDPAGREWRALRLLHEHAPGLAPEPLAAALSADPPTVTMRAVPGDPLGGRPLSQPQLAAIGAALDRLHSCLPADVLARVPEVANPPGRLVAAVRRRLTEQPRPDGDPTAARAYDQAGRWLDGPEAATLADGPATRPVLGRGDHNLTNFLWDGTRVWLVDFEYAGRVERCRELAELLEHISARCTPDEVWRTLIDRLELSAAERARLVTIRRLLATLWLLLLLPGQDSATRNPPGTLGRQAERTLSLLAG